MMLAELSRLRGTTVEARDGEAGEIVDVLFDDRGFSVRWLVVDTGRWLPGRKVLLVPDAVREPARPLRRVHVSATREDIRTAPGIDADAPVSRRNEADLFAHYRWTPWWSVGGTAAGTSALETVPPAATGVPDVEPAARMPEGAAPAETGGDPALRSGREVEGYRIHARDGFVGHVHDLLLDPSDWTVRWFVVDTRDFLPGRRVLLSPDWIRSVGWADREVNVEVDREAVKDAPPYESERGADRDLEHRLYGHYGFTPYWI